MKAAERAQSYTDIAAALAGGDALAALGRIAALRADLDNLERSLIDTARGQGASWAEVAGTLGLRSRQAAEQRSLRLHGRSADVAGLRENRKSFTGTPISTLRAAARALATWLDGADVAPDRAHLADLARSTLEAAADAPPGALIDLVRLALSDLATVPGPPVTPLATALAAAESIP